MQICLHTIKIGIMGCVTNTLIKKCILDKGTKMKLQIKK